MDVINRWGHLKLTPAKPYERPVETVPTQVAEEAESAWQALCDEPAADANIDAVAATLGRLGAWGEPALPRLLVRCEALAGFVLAGPASWPDATTQYVELALINALTQAAARNPQALVSHYENSTSDSARDMMCEAAGNLGRSRPSDRLFTKVLLAHLQHSTAVAALSLATYGDSRCQAHLQMALQSAMGQLRPDPTTLQALREAIASFGLPVDDLSREPLAALDVDAGKRLSIAGWVLRSLAPPATPQR